MFPKQILESLFDAFKIKRCWCSDIRVLFWHDYSKCNLKDKSRKLKMLILCNEHWPSKLHKLNSINKYFVYSEMNACFYWEIVKFWSSGEICIYVFFAWKSHSELTFLALKFIHNKAEIIDTDKCILTTLNECETLLWCGLEHFQLFTIAAWIQT